MTTICHSAQWDAEKGRLYCNVEFAPSGDRHFILSNIECAVRDDAIAIYPPPCIQWSHKMQSETRQAIVNYFRKGKQ